MKKISFLLLTVVLLSISSHSRANDFEAALSSQTAQFTFRSDSSLIGWGGADLAMSLFYNEASDFIGQVGLLQMRQASENTPFTLGVGVKAYVGSLDDVNRDVFAFGVGGQLRYTIPGVMPTAIYLTGHYSPKITSFSDSKEIVDYQFGIQIEALPQTTAFIGIRHLEVKLEEQTYELDDDKLHFGVRLTF